MPGDEAKTPVANRDPKSPVDKGQSAGENKAVGEGLREPSRLEILEGRVIEIEKLLSEQTDLLNIVILEAEERKKKFDELQTRMTQTSDMVQILADTHTGGGAGANEVLTAVTKLINQGGVVNGGPKRVRRGPQKVKDNKTGIVYDSLGSCGKAVAAEFGIDAHTGDPAKDNWVWYQFGPQNPDRFERLPAV